MFRRLEAAQEINLLCYLIMKEAITIFKMTSSSPQMRVERKIVISLSSDKIIWNNFILTRKKIKFCIKDDTMEPASFILKAHVRIHLH